METPKFNITAKYTVGKGNSQTGADITDDSLILFKNNKPTTCPHISGPIQGGNIAVLPCANTCQFFNMFIDKDKEGKETGRISVVLSCGSSTRLPIANLEFKGGQVIEKVEEKKTPQSGLHKV